MSGIISVNGDFFPSGEAKISALDRGFLFGDNIFETFLAVQGTLISPHEHLQRLRDSADQIGLAIPFSDETLLFELRHILTLVSAPKVSLRLVITRGNGLGLVPAVNLTPNRMIYAFPAPKVDERWLTSGIKLLKKRHPYTDRGANAKTGNYLPSIVGIQQAQAKGFDDILWENSNGEITESSIANIFFIGRDGDKAVIETPSVESGLLLGITRKRILSLLFEAKIRADEVIIYGDDLARYDEAFVCSTVRGIIPVACVGTQMFHSTRSSAICKQIERLYQAWIRSQVEM